MLAWATAVPGGAGVGPKAGRCLAVGATAAFVVRRRPRKPPRLRPYSSGRSWRSSCIRLRPLVPSARRWGSTLAAAWWMVPGRPRVDPRTAAAAPRSAGPGPGRAKSPLRQASNLCGIGNAPDRDRTGCWGTLEGTEHVLHGSKSGQSSLPNYGDCAIGGGARPRKPPGSASTWTRSRRWGRARRAVAGSSRLED